ncbi:MAG: methyltransferase [Micropepsaceae bacterium]
MTTTVDAFLGGRVTLEQPASGFRAGLDSVMLAAAVPARPGDTVLELGSGAGAAALCLMARVERLTLIGLEIQDDYAALARANAERNKSAARFLTADVERPPGALEPQSFDQVMMNPPFFVEGPADVSPDPTRRTAMSADPDLVPRWVAAARRYLKPQGHFTAIIPTERLSALLGALARGFGGTTIIPLWPDAVTPAKRIVVTAKLGSRAPLQLRPGLVLHENGRNAAAAEAILRHAGPLAS